MCFAIVKYFECFQMNIIRILVGTPSSNRKNIRHVARYVTIEWPLSMSKLKIRLHYVRRSGLISLNPDFGEFRGIHKQIGHFGVT